MATSDTATATATETRKPLHPALLRFVPQDPARIAELQEEVRQLAKERNAVILAHNYQVPEVQDVADFVGDSLGLAIEAKGTTSPVIALCGVYFMAETAKIINPERTVLIPDETAGCSLADSITVEQLRDWKAQHPGAIVVSYVNTTAAIKAESDYCVTSGNAQAVIRAIPEDKTILFLPDVYLGTWLKRSLGRENMEIWMGECHVHAGIRNQEMLDTLSEYPEADLLIHPECGCTVPFRVGKREGRPARRPHVCPLYRGHGQAFSHFAPRHSYRRDGDRAAPPPGEREPRKDLRTRRCGRGLPLYEADNARKAAR